MIVKFYAMIDKSNALAQKVVSETKSITKHLYKLTNPDKIEIFMNNITNLVGEIKNETVDISILNTQNNTYSLYIYNPNGELVFKQSLGSDTSLGKRFNFEWAHKGDYKFTFVTNQGERSSYLVKTGLN